MVDGPVLVGDALAAGVTLELAFVDVEATRDAALERALAGLADAGVRVVEVGPGVLAGAADPVTPHGLAAIARTVTTPLDALTADPRGLVLVLAGVADPGNAGTLLRSAEASGATAVVTTAGTVDLFAPKTVRASAGALYHVPVVDGGDAASAVRALRDAGFATWGTVARGGVAPDEADLTGAVAIALGSEAHGLAPDVAAAVEHDLTIPMAGRAESLNVAMAGTLVCFEAARQHRARDASNADRPPSGDR